MGGIPPLLVILILVLPSSIILWNPFLSSARVGERISTFCLPASHFGLLHSPLFLSPLSSASSLKGLSPFYQFIFILFPGGPRSAASFPDPYGRFTVIQTDFSTVTVNQPDKVCLTTTDYHTLTNVTDITTDYGTKNNCWFETLVKIRCILRSCGLSHHSI